MTKKRPSKRVGSRTGARAGSAKGKRGAGEKRMGAGPGYKLKGNERYDRHDVYFRKAKRDGYLARSVYKLEEIDEHFKLLKPGDAVLDLGCAPGSWMQYVSRKLDSRRGGCAVGIDLLPTKVNFGDTVRIIEGDIYEATLEQLETAPGRLFDVVLSDMAPNTTGVKSVDQDRSMALCERALEISIPLLATGGNMCLKVLEGAGLREFTLECQRLFETVKIRRPKGTRAGSTETYIVALNKRAPPDPAAEEQSA